MNVKVVFILIGGAMLIVSVAVYNMLFMETSIVDSITTTPNQVSINGHVVPVELVRTSSEIINGLSGRPSLPAGTGMLFIFDPPRIPSFWMKEMAFDLDMIWINDRFEIVDIHANVQRDSYPQAYRPSEAVRYVLEVNAGYSDEKDIKVGDFVEIRLSE